MISVANNVWNSDGLNFTQGEINLSAGLGGDGFTVNTRIYNEGIKCSSGSNVTIISAEEVETNVITSNTSLNASVASVSSALQVSGFIEFSGLSTSTPVSPHRLYLESDGNGDYVLKLKG